ncbi:hypothetical protein [Dactylosporangium matsuzakiense]|uniref:Uncharacterized protein n=1 Tax=Dactylosporangium matsuzakiense TaxID=53360 RepID=A0A9W6NTI7_9ACTN|nr:hypothetical protein [Dactylosporangium matsuzakiense]UWZ47842.1 hypothetical protein Dmats_16420 [Dactylosporangium matsuzakiense]GLL08774.1 hypothetical protein GCM10017581_105470 [Dactylosporangium matsuzakiense]
MDFVGGVNAVLAVVGVGDLYFGGYSLVTGKVPGAGAEDAAEPAEVRRSGVAHLLVSGAVLSLVVGYMGGRPGLWYEIVRDLLFVAAVLFAVIALVKLRPPAWLDRFRRGGEDEAADQHR